MHRIKQEPVEKHPGLLLCHNNDKHRLKEGCVDLCSCGMSKLLRAQHCDIKAGSFDCSSLCVMVWS